MTVRILAFLLFLGILSFVQVKPLLKKGKRKEAAVVVSLMGLSAAVGSLLIAGIDIPSPTVLLRMVFEPIGKAILQE